MVCFTMKWAGYPNFSGVWTVTESFVSDVAGLLFDLFTNVMLPLLKLSNFMGSIFHSKWLHVRFAEWVKQILTVDLCKAPQQFNLQIRARTRAVNTERGQVGLQSLQPTSLFSVPA